MKMMLTLMVACAVTGLHADEEYHTSYALQSSVETHDSADLLVGEIALAPVEETLEPQVTLDPESQDLFIGELADISGSETEAEAFGNRNSVTLAETFTAAPQQVAAEEASPEASQEESWGYHLILDCKGCDIDKISCRYHLERFTRELVNAIGMKAFGDPLLEHFAEHNPEAAGYSLLQFIETSNITAHFVDKNGDAYIDIFSCRVFEPEIAMKVVQQHLNPKNIKKTFLVRKA